MLLRTGSDRFTAGNLARWEGECDLNCAPGARVLGLLGMSQSPQQALEATWPPDGWITKRDAAERLKLSEPRVAAMAGDGTLESRKERNPASNQVVTLINAVAVDRLGFKREHPELTEVVTKPDNANNPGVTKLPAENLNNPKNGAAHQTAPRPWMTIEEATVALQASRALLLRMAESNQYPRTFRDMGKGARGGRWRVLLQGKPEGELF
jgi:hypothetical protein